ncbi:unnamed protein product [Cyclocybe aegerita]|uniref:Metallo-beta-lactamase domain-containing protein n=1 Tax=Cyclocybe aegerita TaxID=1973307 RepID=A0A8S0W0C0_CYCAE|nr:unnamed protein product [Cyclocybe aegerita]
MRTNITLPPPAEDQAFCNVSALEGGHVVLPSSFILANAHPDSKEAMPSLCFLLIHSSSSKRFVFDLGIRPDIEAYPPAVREYLTSGLVTASVPQDVVGSLAKGGLAPDDIDTVCISHCHGDHIGNTHAFARSTFVVGGACQALFVEGKTYPEDPASSYARDLLPTDRTRYLTVEEWTPIGPFPRAFDFYGDGSLYLVDSPGHLQGHLNVLARTSADGAWVYLAGDSAHSWKIITGESEIKVGAPWDPHFCIHVDKEKAEGHIANIRVLWKMPRVRVILAHDTPWYQENRGGPAFWPGHIAAL